MEPFRTLTAVAAPIDLANVNTDQIFPARFIKKPRAVGYAAFAFHDLRRDDEGEIRADFALNQERFRNAKILVGDANFGCGSSREGAVYTLQDYGIRAIIAPSFGDIFAANCLKNGVLTIALPAAMVTELRAELHRVNDPALTIDLEAETVTAPGGKTLAFSPDPFQKDCLLKGLNEIGLSLQFEDEVAAYEAARRERFPWLAQSPGNRR